MENIINQIIFLYWNNQIEQEQMIQYLKDVPPKDLAEWIDDLVNRVEEAMRFATLDGRLNYGGHRDLPEKDLHERILDAAKQLCHKGSMKFWLPSTVMEARDAGFIQDYEYWTAVRVSKEMSDRAKAGKRKLY